MNNPLVSVLITIYNKEKYIGAAIESVLLSTYRNIEVIVVDDCSKDKSLEIARKYEGEDARIKVYSNENNLGDYVNRNKAASYAKGKYLKYIDADDYVYPWGIECLVQMMEKFPNAGWGLCSLVDLVETPFPVMLTPKEAYQYHYFGPGLFHKAPLSSIIKKDCFDAIGGFTGKQHMGDYELWHLMALKFNVVMMPIGMVWNRVHEDQQMNANRTDPRVNFKYTVGAIHFFKKYRDNGIPLSKSQIDQTIHKLNRYMNGAVLRNALKLRFKTALDLCKMKSDQAYTFGKK